MNLKQGGRDTWQRARGQIDGTCNGDLVGSILRIQYKVHPLTYASGTLNSLFHRPPPQFESFFVVPLRCHWVFIFEVLEITKTCTFSKACSGLRSRCRLLGFGSLQRNDLLDAQWCFGNKWLIFDGRWPADSLGRRFWDGLCSHARRRCTGGGLGGRGSPGARRR
jgi:hypothetical protein